MISRRNGVDVVGSPKIAPPRLHSVFERERCFRLLHVALSRPVVWVSAMAGAGKTALVASYIAAMKLPAIWYRCDERDADAAFFFSYLNKAVEALDPHIIPPDFQTGNIDVSSLQYFERLFEALGFPCLLVFDDYHKIPERSLLHRCFSHGLSLLPEGINVVFISRRQPPPPLIRLRAERKLSVVGYDEIKFDVAETAKLIEHTTDLSLHDDMIRLLHNESNGWVTGLIMMSAHVSTDAAGFDRTAVEETLFEYFSVEVFDPLPEDEKDFLIKAAWTAGLTAKGLPTENDRPTRNNHIESDATEACHNVFRDFLFRISKDHYGKRLETVVLQTADALESHGHIEEAVALVIRFGYWDRVETSIRNNAQILIDDGRHTEIDNWFTSIPREIVQTYPQMSYWFGYNKIYLSPDDSTEILEGALVRHNSPGDRLLPLCASIKAAVLSGNDFHCLDNWISECEANLFDVYKDISVDRDREAVAAAIFAALVWRQPQNIAIEYWLIEAEKIVLHSTHIENRIFAGYCVTMYYVWTGLMHKAGVIVDILSYPVRQTKAYPGLRLAYLTAECLYFYYKLAIKDALKTIDEGLAIAGQTGLQDSALTETAAYISLALGDDVRERFGKIRPTSQPAGYCRLSALVEMSKGDIYSAVEYAERSVAMARRLGCPFILGWSQYLCACVLAEAGRFDKSVLALNDIEKIATATKSALLDYLVCTVRTLIYLKTDEIDKFIETFDKSMEKADLAGIKTFLPLNKSVSSVCKALICKETQAAHMLMSLYDIAPDDHSIETYPWDMKIYTLGRFEIFKDGEIVQFSGKPHKMPLTMLKAIIAFGGRAVSSSALIDLMWADSDGDLALKSMFTTLYRLRKILGNFDYVQIANGNLSLDPRHCWLDIWALDAVAREVDDIRQSHRHSPSAAGQMMAEMFSRILSIYKGDFTLEDQSRELEVSLRGRLKYKFIRCCLDAGEFLEKTDKHEHAIECYKKSSMVYPTEEIFYQRLMTCCQRMGRPGEAATAYDMCREILLSMTGSEPSPLTKSIHASSTDKYRRH